MNKPINDFMDKAGERGRCPKLPYQKRQINKPSLKTNQSTVPSGRVVNKFCRFSDFIKEIITRNFVWLYKGMNVYLWFLKFLYVSSRDFVFDCCVHGIG